MHSYLIVGGAEEEIIKLIKKLKLRRIDWELQKIDDVRDLADFTKLALNEKTAVVISDFDKASEEAQNAFLKPLEEPQENLYYMLTASNTGTVLPTIISRCEVIQVQNIKKEINNLDLINKFITGDECGRIAITSKITDREEAIGFVTNLIHVAHEEFIKNRLDANFLESANYALDALKKNGNVQLQLTRMVVNFE